MLQFPDRDLAPDHPDRDLLGAIAERMQAPPGRIALAGSMADFVRYALAETPRVRDAERQAVLTARYLDPVLPGLEALFLALRAGVDPVLRQAAPSPGARPYPLGRCLEITLAVQRRLERLEPAEHSGAAAEAGVALGDFRAAGGELRRGWGDLRGEYFQNALIVGTLYVDVANDTVTPSKPPVQILPFAEADFRPIDGYLHFARIARRYWNHRFLPNHLLPELAPYLPLIQIGAPGGPRLGPMGRHMLGLTLAKGFAPSEEALAAPPLPPAIFACFRDMLREAPSPLAASPEEGREMALAQCRAHRAQARFDCAAAFNRAMLTAQAVNRRLAQAAAAARVRT